MEKPVCSSHQQHVPSNSRDERRARLMRSSACHQESHHSLAMHSSTPMCVKRGILNFPASPLLPPPPSSFLLRLFFFFFFSFGFVSCVLPADHFFFCWHEAFVLLSQGISTTTQECVYVCVKCKCVRRVTTIPSRTRTKKKFSL